MTSEAPERAGVILVADDDEDILALIAFRLERAGYQILTASDGEEALRVALERRPDLAVLDVMMPKLTGLEVTERIRAGAAEVRDMPIVLLTARVQDADLEQGLSSGANEYVKKPFSPQVLRETVDGLLAGRAPSGQAA
jgi:CheY-like chemotaxis protein